MSPAPNSPQRRFWLVTNGAAGRQGWAERLAGALASHGVQLEVLSLPLMLAETARGLVESGADAFARAVRLKSASYEESAGELYARHRPEVVVADHPAALRWLDVLRSATRSDALHVGLLSAWEPASGWSSVRVDAMIACDELQLAALAQTGLAESAFALSPPILSADFSSVQPTTRDAVGLGGHAPLALLDLSLATSSLIQEIYAGLAGRSLPTMAVYYGASAERADACRLWASHYGVESNLFGAPFTTANYSQLCDLVVVTPGVPELSGYLAQGRPVVSIHPTMDPMRPARDGAVVGAADGRALGQVLEFLTTRGVAESHRAGAESYAGADGLATTVEALLAFAERRVEIISAARAATRPVAAPVVSAEGEPSAAPLSPFERVGGGATGAGPMASTPAPAPPLARDEAREQLAALILQERRIEAELDRAAAERDRWMTRVDLAGNDPDPTLRDAAQQQLDHWVATVANLGAQVASIESQKEIVRRRAASVSHASRTTDGVADQAHNLEDRFRALERQRQLDELKDNSGADRPE